MFALVAIAGIAVVICAKVAPTKATPEYQEQEQKNSPVANSVIKLIFM